MSCLTSHSHGTFIPRLQPITFLCFSSAPIRYPCVDRHRADPLVEEEDRQELSPSCLCLKQSPKSPSGRFGTLGCLKRLSETHATRVLAHAFFISKVSCCCCRCFPSPHARSLFSWHPKAWPDALIMAPNMARVQGCVPTW